MNLNTIQGFTAFFAADYSQTRYSANYNAVINEAQTQFCMDTRILFKDFAISVVANTSSYALPTDFMFEKKVTISNVNNATGGVELVPISRATIEFYKGQSMSNPNSDWTQDKGSPLYYNIDPELARQQILLYPQPQAADAGTSNCILTYYPFPAALVNTGDTPFNGSPFMTQFHIAIPVYAAWLLLQSEPTTESTEAKMKSLMDQYNRKTTEAIDRYGNTITEPLRLRGGRLWR